MTKESYLHSVIDMLGSILNILPEDGSLVLLDTDKVIAFLASPTVKVDIPVGTPRSKLANTVSDKAITFGRVFQEERGPEAFGVSYVATSTPLYFEGEVVGALTSAILNHKVDWIRGSSEGLAASVEQMTATSNQIASAFSAINKEMDKLSAKSETLNQDIGGIQSIIGIVQELADTSNLLGLNASIEAAHAGEFGRGFSVVANEIRRMAVQSRESSKDIREQLNQMQERLKEISTDIDAIKHDMSHHSESVKELDEAFEHIAVTANGLMDRFALNQHE